MWGKSSSPDLLNYQSLLKKYVHLSRAPAYHPSADSAVPTTKNTQNTIKKAHSGNASLASPPQAPQKGLCLYSMLVRKKKSFHSSSSHNTLSLVKKPPPPITVHTSRER